MLLRSKSVILLVVFSAGFSLSNCGEPGKAGKESPEFPKESCESLTKMLDHLSQAIRFAVDAIPLVAESEGSYRPYPHCVVIRRPRKIEPGDKIVKEFWFGDRRMLEVEKLPVGGEVIGITNKPRHPARIVANLLAIGADHDFLDVDALLKQPEEKPMRLAFVLLAIEGYKRAFDFVPLAQRILQSEKANPYLLVAALRILARYGFGEDIPLVSAYLYHDDIEVRCAARWAKAILQEDTKGPNVREGSLPRFPPYPIEVPGDPISATEYVD